MRSRGSTEKGASVPTGNVGDDGSGNASRSQPRFGVVALPVSESAPRPAEVPLPRPLNSENPPELKRPPLNAIGAVSLSTFLAVAHNSLLMLLGLIGGITAQWLHATRRDEHSPPSAGHDTSTDSC